MWGLILSLSLVLLPACQTEKVTFSDGRPIPPPPRPAEPAPTGAQPNAMALMVSSRPDDTNGNGYPDLIPVTVALFAKPHETAVVADGGSSFVFTLYPKGQIGVPGVQELGTWTYAGDTVARAQTVAIYGPCYRFRLSLLEVGAGEIHRLNQADLVCRYQPPAPGHAVDSDSVRTVQIGKRTPTSPAVAVP